MPVGVHAPPRAILFRVISAREKKVDLNKSPLKTHADQGRIKRYYGGDLQRAR